MAKGGGWGAPPGATPSEQTRRKEASPQRDARGTGPAEGVDGFAKDGTIGNDFAARNGVPKAPPLVVTKVPEAGGAGTDPSSGGGRTRDTQKGGGDPWGLSHRRRARGEYVGQKVQLVGSSHQERERLDSERRVITPLSS